MYSIIQDVWDEDFLKAMTNSTPSGILALNNKTDEVVYCNHRFCKIFQVEEFEEKILKGEIKNSELIGHCIKSVKDQSAYYEIFSPTWDIDNFELEFWDQQGQKHFAVTNETLFQDEKGEKYIIASIRDGTLVLLHLN